MEVQALGSYEGGQSLGSCWECLLPKHVVPTPLVTHRNKEDKMKKIILASVKNHFVLHIWDNTTCNNMISSLFNLSHNSCSYQQIILQNQLPIVHEIKIYTMVINLTRISELKDYFKTIRGSIISFHFHKRDCPFLDSFCLKCVCSRKYTKVSQDLGWFCARINHIKILFITTRWTR